MAKDQSRDRWIECLVEIWRQIIAVSEVVGLRYERFMFEIVHFWLYIDLLGIMCV